MSMGYFCRNKSRILKVFSAKACNTRDESIPLELFHCSIAAILSRKDQSRYSTDKMFEHVDRFGRFCTKKLLLSLFLSFGLLEQCNTENREVRFFRTVISRIPAERDGRKTLS